LIHEFLQRYKLTEEDCNEITIGCDFCDKSSSCLPTLELLIEKAFKINKKAKAKYIDKINPVILEGRLNSEKFSFLAELMQTYNANETIVSQNSKFFIETSNISHLNPQSLSDFGKVFMNYCPISDKTIF
jgi:hypothetical protein